MNVNRAIAAVLRAEGIDWAAAFPAQTLIDDAARDGIRPIICRQERVGVNIADGFSRVRNGRPVGVFTMQSGPGAENAFAGVAQAYGDSTPILLLPGGQPTARTQLHPNFDSVPNYRGVTKWAARIDSPSRVNVLLRNAFNQLKNGRPGPVLVEIPGDLSAVEVPSDAPAYEPTKPVRSCADPADVRDLVTALLRASCPVINAGQGVLMAEATEELQRLAELTHVPVLTTLAGKSAFAENHPLALGTGGHTGTLMVHHFLGKTDFVLGIGTSFTVSAFNAPMPTGVPLAHVTNCAEDLNKDYRVSYGAVGDAKLVLGQMIEEAQRQLGEGGRGDVNGAIDEIATVRGRFMEEWGPRLNSDEVPVSPYRVMTELTRVVDPSKAIVTHDSGHPRDQIVPFWPVVTPRGYLGWGKSTQLGFGLGLAMGAKLADPDKHVINFMGDAAIGMTGMDLETAVRSEIPILTIVLNNGVMTAYSEKHLPYTAERWGSHKLGGRYSDVATALGGYSERVETPDEIAPALRRCLAENAAGRPALLEVITKEETTVPNFW